MYLTCTNTSSLMLSSLSCFFELSFTRRLITCSANNKQHLLHWSLETHTSVDLSNEEWHPTKVYEGLLWSLGLASLYAQPLQDSFKINGISFVIFGKGLGLQTFFMILRVCSVRFWLFKLRLLRLILTLKSDF